MRAPAATACERHALATTGPALAPSSASGRGCTELFYLLDQFAAGDAPRPPTDACSCRSHEGIPGFDARELAIASATEEASAKIGARYRNATHWVIFPAGGGRMRPPENP